MSVLNVYWEMVNSAVIEIFCGDIIFSFTAQGSSFGGGGGIAVKHIHVHVQSLLIYVLAYFGRCVKQNKERYTYREYIFQFKRSQPCAK